MEEMRPRTPSATSCLEFENPEEHRGGHPDDHLPEIWAQTCRDASTTSSPRRGRAAGSARRTLPEGLRGGGPRVRAAEPAECALISARRWGPHGIAGIGDGIVPRNLDLAVIDGIVAVTTSGTRRDGATARPRRGDLLRNSPGCNVVAALEIARPPGAPTDRHRHRGLGATLLLLGAAPAVLPVTWTSRIAGTTWTNAPWRCSTGTLLASRSSARRPDPRWRRPQAEPPFSSGVCSRPEVHG